MCEYQICALDSGGLTVSHYAMECMDDRAALARATAILHAGGVAEIWAGHRNVAILTVPFAVAANLAALEVRPGVEPGYRDLQSLT